MRHSRLKFENRGVATARKMANEAPLVIGPRAIARLVRQVMDAFYRRRQ